MSTPKRLIGFYHCALMGNYEEVNDEIFKALSTSGLLGKLQRLFISVVGPGRLELPKWIRAKANIIYENPDLKKFEYPILEFLQGYCKIDNDCKILKFHDSGVSNTDGKYPNWRRLQVHHLIMEHQKAIDLLDQYDACGIEIQETPAPHFSGNWFWANAKYINTLPPVNDMKNYTPGGIGVGEHNRHGCEWWSHCNEFRKCISLYQTGALWHEQEKTRAVTQEFLDGLASKYWEKK